MPPVNPGIPVDPVVTDMVTSYASMGGFAGLIVGGIFVFVLLTL